MAKPNILLVGHICIDHNQSENTTYEGWGSSVLYMTQFLRRTYGVEPTAVSNYGPDMLAYLPEVALLPAGPSHAKTLRYENDSRAGKRIQHVRNVEFASAPDITPEIMAALGRADILVVATLLPNYGAAYLRKLLEHVRPSCLKVLCPQGYFRHVTEDGLVVPRKFDEATQIVPYFDIVLYSEEDCPDAFGLAKQWRHLAANTTIIVTQSSRGASIFGKDGMQHIPTTPIPFDKIVDSVGCGDTFAATVAYVYWQTRNFADAVRQGHQAAGRKLQAVPAAGDNTQAMRDAATRILKNA